VVAVDDDDHSCKLGASALACLLGIFMFSAITDLKTFRKLTSDIVCRSLSYSLVFFHGTTVQQIKALLLLKATKQDAQNIDNASVMST